MQYKVSCIYAPSDDLYVADSHLLNNFTNNSKKLWLIWHIYAIISMVMSKGCGYGYKRTERLESKTEIEVIRGQQSPRSLGIWANDR